MKIVAITSVLIIGMLLASGTVLVITGHGDWAWIPFLLLPFVNVKINDKDKDVG